MRRMKLSLPVGKLGAQAPGVVAGVELPGEQDVLQLRGAVGQLRGEVPVVVQVVDVQMSEQARARAGGLDYRGAAGQQRVHEEIGQQERGEVVDLKGLLEPVGGLGAVAEDAAGVVHQHVNAGVDAVQ